MTNQNQQNEEIQFAFHVQPDGSVDPKRVVRGNAVLELPPRVYSLASELGRGLYLKPEHGFELPKKLYGKVHQHADRFLKAYELGSRNLGVLLLGEPGSGKTLTLKQVVTKGLAMGMPTILINEKISGEALTHFLGSITQPCVVCFDEFDKTYKESGGSESSQVNILQFLDGATTGSKKLVIFTANSDDTISPYLKKDRPSRIRYTIRYQMLEADVVIDYVQQNLKHCTEEHLRAFLMVAKADRQDGGLNFDSMAELVSEMNNFGCSLDEARSLMMRSGAEVKGAYDVTIFEGAAKVDTVVGWGDQDGAYLASSDYVIRLQRVVPDPEKPGKVMKQTQILTREHFVGYGEDHDTYEFRQNDTTFVVRQVPSMKAHLKASQQERDFSKHNQDDPLTGSMTPSAVHQPDPTNRFISQFRSPYAKSISEGWAIEQANKILEQRHLSPNPFSTDHGSRRQMYGVPNQDRQQVGDSMDDLPKLDYGRRYRL